MGFMAAAIATTVGILFHSQSRHPGESGFFTSIAVAGYVAAWFGAWWEQTIWIGMIAVLVTIAGAYAAYRVARNESYPGYNATYGIAVVSVVATTLAAVAVVTGFWVTFDFKSFHIVGGIDATFSPVTFALIAGAIPPATAVAAARICGIICRRQIC